MSGISLTAPMRSNLLALQNIARQQDVVQNRLATGLKVSSAIDNPSSYYTAASLSNRAADLSALLDAMSQGVQTIKTASEAITSATKFLEQAKATANQALETAIPAKSWFEEQANVAAVVSDWQELKTAVNSGKSGNIVIYGEITLQDTLILKDGQNLVGIGYYGNFDMETDKFSKLKMDISAFSQNIGIRAEYNNTTISDLSFNIKFADKNNCKGLYLGTTETDTKGNILKNLDFNLDTSAVTEYPTTFYRIYAIYGGGFELKGTNNIRSSVNQKNILHCIAYSYIEMHNDSLLNVNSRNTEGSALNNSTLNLYDNAYLNVYTRYRGISVSQVTMNNNSRMDIYGSDYGFLYGSLTINDQTSVNIKAYNDFYSHDDSSAFFSTFVSINSTQAALNLTKSNAWFQNNGNNLSFSAIQGAKIILDGQLYTFNQTCQNQDINDTVLLTMINKSSDQSDHSPKWNNLLQEQDEKTENAKQSTAFKQILEQFDMLIADASYKGINLLQGQNLKINFNEDRSSMIEVPGYDVNTESLGLVTKEWQTQEDIEKSISELESAISSLRSFASAFGNYYSIVTTRQDFTENLINVLEEGADKLTLADMNEESANMLALQTSQQLAINSLSLASQAAQSVLKLF